MQNTLVLQAGEDRQPQKTPPGDDTFLVWLLLHQSVIECVSAFLREH